MRLPKVACAVNSSTGRASKSPGFPSPRPPRTGEVALARVALPRAHTLPLLIEARGEPAGACKRIFGANLRANAKDRDLRRRSAGTVRCGFPPVGSLFFRSQPIGKLPTSALKRRHCGCEAFCDQQVAPSLAWSFVTTASYSLVPAVLCGAVIGPMPIHDRSTSEKIVFLG